MKNYPQIQSKQIVLALFVSLLAMAQTFAQCDPPTNLVVGNQTATTATVSWSASPSEPATGYQYEVRTFGAPGSSVDPASGYVISGNTADGILSTTVENLDFSSTYYFYVRYQCGPTEYSSWTTSAEIVTTTLQAPVATAAIYISDDSFLARWNPSEGAASYRLDVSTSPDFSTFVPNFENRLVTITSSVVSELLPSTTYYYRVRAEGEGGEGPITTANSNTITVTTLAVPLTYVVWTEAGWSGDPLLELDAIIDWPFNTATDQVFEAKSLTINSGQSLTIAAGTYVIVDNEITNNAGAEGLVIENNGNLLQLNDAAVNSGPATVIRDSAPIFRLDYTMWSSPVVGTQTLAQFSPQTISTRFYTYTTATDLFTPHSPSNTFVQGAGYLIRTPNNHVPYVDETSVAETWTGSFVGTPGNGTVSIGVSDAGNGYNMVGNPYPSVVSAENFFLLNQDNIEGILYFWRRRNSTTPGDTGSYYATYTNLGGTASDTSEVPNGFIQTGQGFIIQAKTGATEVAFDNTIRVSDNFENQFFRSQQEVEKHRLWLNLTNDNGVFSQALVGYMDGATNAFDQAIDGRYINDSDVALTSVLGQDELVIQGRALPFSVADFVPMQFKTNAAGNYSISLSSFDGLFGSQDIFLEDTQQNVVHDLKQGAYGFASEAGVFPDRFKIVFENSSLGINNPEIQSSVIAFKDNGGISVSASGVITSVKVFDLLGRLVASRAANTDRVSISNLGIANQLVLVQIETETGIVTKKVML